MEIYFRQVCEVCGDSPKVLACDSGKIGIGFKHSFIRHIEESDSEIQTQQSRRIDRCFFYLIPIKIIQFAGNKLLLEILKLYAVISFRMRSISF